MTTRHKGSIGKQVVHSSAWLYGRHLVTNVFNVFVTALLARKLSPGDFGVIALASVILRFLTTLGPIGVGEYIIYDHEAGREERVHAAFWLNIVLTVAAVGICSAMVPLVSLFYEVPDLRLILYLLIAQFAIGQLAGVPDALLRRALNFKKLALRETVLEIASGAGMMVMAMAGFGVWSLIVPAMVLTPIRVIVAFQLAHWVPSMRPRKSLWPGIFQYSFHTTGAGFVNLLASEGDVFIIGKRLGTADLGFYNQAMGTANLVNRNVSGVVAKVAMPALSAVSRDMDRLRAGLNRMLRLLALTSFPLMIGLLVIADLFVFVLFGPKWEASIIPLRVLLIFALLRTVSSPSTVIFNVIGRPDIMFKMGLAFLPFYFLSVWAGSFYGMVGVAVGVTVARTTYCIFQLRAISRLVGQTLRTTLAEMGQALIAAITTGGLVLGCRLLLSALEIPGLALLLALVLIGGLTWFVLLLHVFPQSLEELLLVCDAFSSTLGSKVRRTIKPMLA